MTCQASNICMDSIRATGANIKINPFNLSVSLSNEFGFISNDISFLISLVTEDPFCVDDVHTLWSWNKSLDIIFLKLMKLIIHSFYLAFILKCFLLYFCRFNLRQIGRVKHNISHILINYLLPQV